MRLVLRLLRVLQVSKISLAIAVLTSIVSGLAAVGTLICILQSVRTNHSYWWQFICFAVLAVVSRLYSRLIPTSLTISSILRLRRRMIRSILHMPLEDLERIGAARLLVGFTSDLTNIGAAVRSFVHIFSSAAFLLAGVGYVAWLSPARAVVTAVLVVVTIVIAILLRRSEKAHAQEVRQVWDRVVHMFRIMLDGIKQMKLNRLLSRQVLRSFESRNRNMQNATGQRRWYSEMVPVWIHSMSFVILGVAIFAPFFNDDTSLLVGGFGVLALLYIRAPLQSMVLDSGAFAEATVGLERIYELGLTLDNEASEHRTRGDLREESIGARSPNWTSLELRNVVFRYRDSHPDDDFALGPVDIVLHPGEIVFVSGGNGSGKTTLLKVLVGLYSPVEGTILYDGKPIGESMLRYYQNKFAVVFSDFCLFEGVADLDFEELSFEAKRIANRFKFKPWMLAPLENINSSAKLSAGEQRRAALLIALLDDRPILVLDEWAADQDPQYKDIFYLEILPSLRAKNKLVVVLSHDERYFHLGDRVLWLERGRPPIWRTAQSFAAKSDSEPTNAGDPPGIVASAE